MVDVAPLYQICRRLVHRGLPTEEGIGHPSPGREGEAVVIGGG